MCQVYSYTPTGTQYPAPPVVTITQSATAPSGGAGSVTAAGVTATGSGATVTAPIWLTIAWSWEPNFPTPTGFEVVAFTGADPTNAANYLFDIVTVGPGTLSYTVAVTPNSSEGTVNAAVRAIYA